MTSNPQLGAIFGHYQLLAPSESTGVSELWVAREQLADDSTRLVLLRVFPGLAHDQAALDALVRATGQLHLQEHDNVATTYQVSVFEDSVLVAGQWIMGETFLGLLEQSNERRRWPIETAVRMVADAAKGLAATQPGGVASYISPAQIVVGVDGRVRVRGTASQRVMPEDRREVHEGYLSPEQARGRPADERSDVFALGVMLYELSTSARLFEGEDRHHTLGLVMRCQIPPPSSHRPGYPAALSRIVEQALSNNPSQRFGSVAEFSRALERFLVAERTLVSTGSIAARLFRIRGAELGAQHQRLSQALLSVVGTVDRALLPELPSFSGAGSSTDDGDRESLPHSGSAATAVVLSSSDEVLTGARTESTQRLPPLVWGLLAAAAVFVAMLALGRLKAPSFAQPDDETMHVATPAEERSSPVSSIERAPRRPDLSVDDLPVEEKKPQPRWGGAAPGAAPAAPAPPAASEAPMPGWLQQAQGVTSPLPQESDTMESRVAQPEADFDPELVDESEPVLPPSSAAGGRPPIDEPPAKKITNPYLESPTPGP